MKIVFQLSADELSINGKNFNPKKSEYYDSMQPSHGVPFFVRSNRNEALHMPIGFCCNLSRVMYGGESTRNLEAAVSVVEGFGVRVEGSFLKWTMVMTPVIR